MKILTALLALALIGAPAEAGLVGQAMSGHYAYPDAGTVYPSAAMLPSSFVIDAGMESTTDVEHVTNLLVDFGDSDLTITFETVLSSPTWNNTAFNGLVFTAAHPTNINAAFVNPATTMIGFDDSRVWWTETQIFIDWHGLSYRDGTQLVIDFSVPEPASAMLLATSLLLLRRTKRKAA